MAVQTSYNMAMDRGFPGMLSDMSAKDARTYANGEASAEIPFGVAVAQGNTADKAALPAGAGAKVVGVVLHSHDYAKPLELGAVGVKPKAPLSVLRKGRCLVLVEEAVAVNDPAYARHTVGAGGTQLGAFRKSADTATAAQVKGAFFVTAAGAGGLAELEVDMPNHLGA